MIITAVDVNNKQSPNFKILREGGREDYLFVLFKSPSQVLVNGSYESVDKGMCIFFDKHKIQSYFPRVPFEFVHDYMHFDIESNYAQMLFSAIPKGELISLSLPELISDTLLDIQHERERMFSKYKSDILTHLGALFFLRISSELEHRDINEKKRKNFANLYALRAEMHQHPEADWSIDILCRKACMSRSYFQHLYKEFFNISCGEDLIAARISLAKKLLLSSNTPVQIISEMCGYKNVTHFIRQFKQIVGITPEKFRSR